MSAKTHQTHNQRAGEGGREAFPACFANSMINACLDALPLLNSAAGHMQRDEITGAE